MVPPVTGEALEGVAAPAAKPAPKGRLRMAMGKLRRRFGRARMQGGEATHDSGNSVLWSRVFTVIGAIAGGAAAGWGQGQLRPDPPAPVPLNGSGGEIREQLRRIESQLVTLDQRGLRNAELIAAVQAELTARANERAMRMAEVERSIDVVVERVSDVEANMRELQRRAPR